jgi:hypothetical protein
MIVNIIHLPEREDRLELLQKEIDAQGLTVVYWPGVKDPLNRVFVGISQAHKQIVRDAKAKKLPMVCIAEDDLYFFAPGAWQYFLDNIPTDFDIYLGVVFHGLNEDNTTDDWCGMGLYIVNERFYDTFLAANEVNHLDRALARKGRFVVCDPMICSQRAGFSDNKKHWDSYDRYLVGKRLFGREIGP